MANGITGSCDQEPLTTTYEVAFNTNFIQSEDTAITTEKCLMRNDGRMNPAAITDRNFPLWVINEFVTKWSHEQDSNRKMRESFAQKNMYLVVFILIVNVGIIFCVGTGFLNFTEEMLKWIIGSFGAEVIGAFICMVKYLFTKDDNGANKMFSLLGGVVEQSREAAK